jgi:hypothetical protein
MLDVKFTNQTMIVKQHQKFTSQEIGKNDRLLQQLSCTRASRNRESPKMKENRKKAALNLLKSLREKRNTIIIPSGGSDHASD